MSYLLLGHKNFLLFSFRVSIADTGNISIIVESLIEHSDWFFPDGKFKKIACVVIY